MNYITVFNCVYSNCRAGGPVNYVTVFIPTVVKVDT